MFTLFSFLVFVFWFCSVLFSVFRFLLLGLKAGWSKFSRQELMCVLRGCLFDRLRWEIESRYKQASKANYWLYTNSSEVQTCLTLGHSHFNSKRIIGIQYFKT